MLPTVSDHIRAKFVPNLTRLPLYRINMYLDQFQVRLYEKYVSCSCHLSQSDPDWTALSTADDGILLYYRRATDEVLQI